MVGCQTGLPNCRLAGLSSTSTWDGMQWPPSRKTARRQLSRERGPSVIDYGKQASNVVNIADINSRSKAMAGDKNSPLQGLVHGRIFTCLPLHPITITMPTTPPLQRLAACGLASGQTPGTMRCTHPCRRVSHNTVLIANRCATCAARNLHPAGHYWQQVCYTVRTQEWATDRQTSDRQGI